MDLEPVRLDGIDGIAASLGSIAPHLTQRAVNPVWPVHHIHDRAPTDEAIVIDPALKTAESVKPSGAAVSAAMERQYQELMFRASVQFRRHLAADPAAAIANANPHPPILVV